MRMGMGDFSRSAFAVPQNPVGLAGLADFVAGKFAVPQNPVVYGLGDTVPTAPMYPIPQNTVISGWKSMGMSGLGCGGSKDDCGCGCSGKGVGSFDLSSITTAFSTAIADTQTAISTMSLAPITSNDWMVLGATAIGIYLIADSLSKGGRR